uniref:Tf2-1-like SH3-like domain-containing protein n=1 Tax=Arundo donax TaxID=35708 RepID=A0A0A9A6G6_ARUDO
MSAAHRSSQKLSFRYFGPYQILQRIGALAYCLKLPEGSRIHPVVHVSFLKKAIPSNEQVCPDDPSICFPNDSLSVSPMYLLSQLVKQGDKVVTRVLVQWEGLSPELAMGRIWLTCRSDSRLLCLGDKTLLMEGGC